MAELAFETKTPRKDASRNLQMRKSRLKLFPRSQCEIAGIGLEVPIGAPVEAKDREFGPSDLG